MLGLSMMLGGGLPVYRVEINSNTNNWSLATNAPQAVKTFAIDLTIAVGPGVTIGSTVTAPAMLINSVTSGSVIRLVNQGTIRGQDGVPANAGTVGVKLDTGGCQFLVDNGSGYIYAGYDSYGSQYGYALLIAANNTFQWVSGASRILGTVLQI
jgi:hypothetical protein